jgi:hypothetical protein
MTIFGKPLLEYVRFARVFIVLVAVVGIARLALSLGGAPNPTAKWLSMTGLAWIAVFYYAIRVHTSGFGSYKQLLPVLALVNLTAQVIAMAAIAIAIFTGTNNIFSAPEYAFGSDGKTWTHFAAHLFIGTTIGSLVPWAFGSLILFVSKKLFPNNRNTAAAARA